MKKQIIMFFAAAMAAVAFAAPEVTDVVAKQRYPWNGLVDITCRVTGIEGTTNGLKFAVAAVNLDSGDVHPAYNFWIVLNGTKLNSHIVHTNGNYRLLWDSQTDLGQRICSNMVMRIVCVDAHKVQLWEGGPYWANTNIGAMTPEDYGYYFWWGDTVGYKRLNDAWVASDGSSSKFFFNDDNTPTYNKSIDTLKSQGWITADNVLVPEHDAAQVHWGAEWRMPTKQELNDLNSECNWIWTTKNGVYGYIVSGKNKYAIASIFLPAAGEGWWYSAFSGGESEGKYWSSVPVGSQNASWVARQTKCNYGQVKYSVVR